MKNRNYRIRFDTLLVLFISILVINFKSVAQTNKDSKIDSNLNGANKDENAQKPDTIFFDYELLDKYIAMAIDHSPNLKISDYRTNVAKQDIKLAKYAWTNNLSGQLNLNQNNQSQWGIGKPKTNLDGTPATNTFFPLYGLTLRLTVATFALTPMEVKRAKEMYKITLQDKENQNMEIVNLVTKSYQNYIIKQKSLLLKLEAETKSHLLYGYVTKASNSKDPNYIEREAQAFTSYSQAQEFRNIAEAELRMAKFDLEMLIGTKLENVK